MRCLFFLFFLLLYAPFSIAKYQVCSITINSADEIQVFKKFLPQEDFEFTELLPKQINEKQDHSTHWFDSACEKDLQCDILIVSGHFGGTFFGKSGYALPTELLEEKACQKSCPGKLSHLKEIFLFGCNTLASKKKDSRSYTEYLKVLLDDGMARETAERVVAARYSPLGTPFYKRMHFIFSGSHTIYGFDESGPLGEYARGPLENYFQSIHKLFGSYTKYLDTRQYKRSRNTELFQNFSGVSLNQAHISLAEESLSQRTFFKRKCLLYDNTAEFDQQMQALKGIFESKQAGSAFFAIDSFLENNKREVMEGSGREIFRMIRNNSSFSEEILSYYQHLDFLPYIKLVYLSVLEKFRWIDSYSLKVLKKKDILELIKKPDSEAYISLLLLLQRRQITPGELYISRQDLPSDYIQNIWSLLIFEKLKAFAPDWQTDMLKYCKKHIQKEPAICYQVLNTLAHIQPTLETVEKAKVLLDYEDTGLVYYTIRMLGQTHTKDYLIHKKIASFLSHKDSSLQLEALEALGFLRSPYSDIQNDMAKFLPQASDELALDIFWSFRRMDLGEDVQKSVISYILQSYDKLKNEELLKSAFSALQNTSELSDFSLDFFYSQLEVRNHFLFDIIEMLSRNSKLRDLGIHYRFLQFQDEAPHIKREALKRMAFLRWLHPDVQIHFLAYVKDSDPVVRMLAINIFKNIENLENKTLKEMKIFYKEDRINELAGFF